MGVRPADATSFAVGLRLEVSEPVMIIILRLIIMIAGIAAA
jgi:hypothetical protein